MYLRIILKQHASFKSVIDFNMQNVNIQQGPGVVETLYKNKNILEGIFLMIDKDNSGKY